MDSSFITLTECVLERLSTHKTHISLFLNKKQRLLPQNPLDSPWLALSKHFRTASRIWNGQQLHNIDRECLRAFTHSQNSKITIFEQKTKVVTFKTHWIHPEWHCQSIYGRHQEYGMTRSFITLTQEVLERFPTQIAYVELSDLHEVKWSSSQELKGHPLILNGYPVILNGHPVIL